MSACRENHSAPGFAVGRVSIPDDCLSTCSGLITDQPLGYVGLRRELSRTITDPTRAEN